MSKVKPMALVESMSGKICEHSNVYFRTNKRTGTVTSGKLCNPYAGDPSEDQAAIRTMFANAVSAAKAIKNAKSSDEDQSNYTKLVAYEKQYASARRFAGSLFNFIMKKEFAAMKAGE